MKTAQTVCYEILREIVREACQFNAREYRMLASQQVIDSFLHEEPQALAELADFIAKPISMQIAQLADSMRSINERRLKLQIDTMKELFAVRDPLTAEPRGTFIRLSGERGFALRL